MGQIINCTASPSHEHEYIVSSYSRDDSGFWIDCAHCKQPKFFECDTEDDLYAVFGIYDDDNDDYSNDDE